MQQTKTQQGSGERRRRPRRLPPDARMLSAFSTSITYKLYVMNRSPSMVTIFDLVDTLVAAAKRGFASRRPTEYQSAMKAAREALLSLDAKELRAGMPRRHG